MWYLRRICLRGAAALALVCVAASTWLTTPVLASSAYNITTLAGGGVTSPVDGTLLTNAQLNYPSGIITDANGNILFTDSSDNRVFVAAEVTGTFYGISMVRGDIYVIGGNGTLGDTGNGAVATSAEFDAPRGIALDPSGNVVIADTGNDVIRVIAESSATFYGVSMTARDVYQIAGTAGTAGHTGNGGVATGATFNGPWGIAIDSAGNILVADIYSDEVRCIAETTGTYYGVAMTKGDVYACAGDFTAGDTGANGPAISAEINEPDRIALDTKGNMVFSDGNNDIIQVVANVTSNDDGIAMTVGDIYTVAGTPGVGSYGGDGGAATSADLNVPNGVVVDSSGNILIADQNNNVIRCVAEATGSYYGLAMTSGDIYTVAGNGTAGNTGSGGSATTAEINSPSAVAVWNGGFVITDSSNSLVQEVLAPSATATQTVDLTTGPGSLTVSVPSTVNLGTVSAGSLISDAALGTVTWTDTLNDAASSSVAIASTDFYQSATQMISFDDVSIGVGKTITANAQNTGSADSPGAAGPTSLSGTDSAPGTTFSNSVDLASGSGTSEGSYSQAGNDISVIVPANQINDSGLVATVQYTVTG